MKFRSYNYKNGWSKQQTMLYKYDRVIRVKRSHLNIKYSLTKKFNLMKLDVLAYGNFILSAVNYLRFLKNIIDIQCIRCVKGWYLKNFKLWDSTC